MSTHAATIEVGQPALTKQFGVAWLSLCAALAFHVADEATTDFLSVYNLTILSIRSRLPFLPLPTFSFGPWLTGLILAIAVLLCLTPLAFRGSRVMLPLAYIFAIFMLGNGLLHIGGSIFLRRLLPGVYSAPLLLIGSIFLLATARLQRRKSS